MTDAILFACVCVAVGAAYFTGWTHSQIRARSFLDSAAIELRQSDEIAEQWRASAACIAEIHRCSGRVSDSNAQQLRSLARSWKAITAKQRADMSKLHRRAQRAESATAAARREAVGQRKRADWWRSEAKRLGWTKGGE